MGMKKSASLILAGMLLLALVLPTGCAKLRGSVPSQGIQPTPGQQLKVGLLYDEEALPAYIAEQEGLFQKDGVNVQLIPFRSAAERDSAVQSGAVDGAEGDLVAVALLNQGGFPVKAVSVALGAKPEEGRFYILAAPNTITRVEDLQGKTLAVSQNTIIDFLADEMLMAKGINPDRVQKVYIPNMPMRLQMLMQKNVAAALLPDPLASVAKIEGATVLVDKTKLPVNLSQSVLFFRDGSIKTKPDAIKGYLQAYAQAEQEVDQNPERYRQLFYDKVDVPKAAQGLVPVPSFSPPQTPSHDNVQLVLDWMNKKKLLTKSLSYDDLVTGAFIGVK
jgi:NitT/TauT family transport system substrate-binding protein